VARGDAEREDPHGAPAYPVSLKRLSVLLAFAAATGCARAGRRASIIYNAMVGEVAPSEAIVEINRSFIERYKNRVTISTNYTVDAVPASPNPNIFDGDLHVAGRAPEIGLRLVAELKNADSATAARALIQRAESTHAALPFTGVWRLWPEHVIAAERQDRPVPELKTPNVDHIFEIHPLTRAGGIDLLGTLHPTEGYRPGSPAKTFEVYQAAKCALTLSPTTVTLTTSNWLWNDVHFLLAPSGDPPVVVSDGRFITAAALDTDGNLLVDKLRMVLVKGSEPERVISALTRGARVHVWGLPRISFAEISRRIQESTSNPAVLKGSLPYEIIVVGVYADAK
jgi:hypothetical protein